MSNGWDDVLKNSTHNGFVYRGGLDPNRKDKIYAFDLGNSGWISFKSANLSDLVVTTERLSQIKKPKNLLSVSEPPEGGLERWFYLMKQPKPAYDKLRIYIYDSEKRAENDPSNPNTTFTFAGLKILGDEKVPTFLKFIPMPLKVYTFEYDRVDVTGQRA